MSSTERLHALCIGRHRFLSEHYCSVFADFGIEATPIVGFGRGIAAARAQLPDLVFCDYDLLAGPSLNAWSGDDQLSAIPLVAVSLTRRPDEVHLPVGEGISNFLYLPLLTRETALLAVRAAVPPRVRPPADALRWEPDRLEHRTPE